MNIFTDFILDFPNESIQEFNRVTLGDPASCIAVLSYTYIAAVLERVGCALICALYLCCEACALKMDSTIVFSSIESPSILRFKHTMAEYWPCLAAKVLRIMASAYSYFFRGHHIRVLNLRTFLVFPLPRQGFSLEMKFSKEK